MQILISAPRTGSSWVYDRIEADNITMGAEPIRPSEFLRPIHPRFDGSIYDKLKWLQIQRDAGIEMTFKHHINYLITDGHDLYNEWFREFYQNDEIVVLRRRDTWNWFRSFMIQDLMNWQPAGINETNLGDLDELTFESDPRPVSKTIVQFVNIKTQLDQVDGQTIWYEDQVDNWDSTSMRLSGLIDYDEILGRNFDMCAVQEELNRCLKN